MLIKSGEVTWYIPFVKVNLKVSNKYFARFLDVLTKRNVYVFGNDTLS